MDAQIKEKNETINEYSCGTAWNVSPIPLNRVSQDKESEKIWGKMGKTYTLESGYLMDANEQFIFCILGYSLGICYQKTQQAISYCQGLSWNIWRA